MVTVLVCGGRDFDDRELLYSTLERLHNRLGFSKLIHGGARGADCMAGEWAFERNIPVEEFLADWDTGRGAGIRRNTEMLQKGKPDLVVVFPGGKGTANMIHQTQLARSEGAKIGLVQIYQRKLITPS